MFEGFKDASLYQEELRKVKREHFKRVSDLEDENHKLKNDLKQIEVKYETQILALKQQLEMERGNLSLQAKELELLKQKKLVEAEREIGNLKTQFAEERFEKMESLAEREKETLRTLVAIAMQNMPKSHQFSLDGDIAQSLIKKLAPTTEYGTDKE